MAAEHTTLAAYVMAMLNKGMERKHIEALLYAKGHDELFIASLITETARLRDARRRSRSLLFMLAGAVVCFLSFLFTITGSFSDPLFPYILYGLTGAGIMLAFVGAVRIF